ncbi:hypothetical protein EDD37DRAFT_358336 [Exophiala viscosa]|uniref:uncharacterized protein n=1 Tax=Exophiala viscosa TaxID=2486360 RepID=UPI0021A157E8|nr:hypothetical protein EDD37DRAFT_358336 [Exophiala viscosa]
MERDVSTVWLQPPAKSALDASPTAVSYDAGYIVLSFFTSLVGCITTIELLQRRTSTRGVYNWFLLFASAITMGGIGIWGMHFVGNRAIVLDHGNPQRQIAYSSGPTAASFFLPIAVLLFAFYLLGNMSNKARHRYIAIAGVLTGAAVCGMHYMGQLGIANYDCTYQVQHVVGAAIIAVAASLIALSVFFTLRDKWIDHWWKRALCAGVLAVAVSGMHWTAAVGTVYHWNGIMVIHGGNRIQTSVIAASLSIGACVGLLVGTFVRGRKMHSAKQRSQRLVLACAYFNQDGKLMVCNNGILPNTEITNHYVEKTFGEDELSRSHETFLWIFQASHHWNILKDLIPAMKADLEADPMTKKYCAASPPTTLPDDASEISINFARLFKQLFCIAAQALANNIHEPVENVGTLFEEPMDTGAAYPRSSIATRRLSCFSASASHTGDIEQGSDSRSIAKGKYLFLIRQISFSDAAKFSARGYRFAAVDQVADTLARSLQVQRGHLVERMERMRFCAERTCLPPPGVYLSLFMIRPSMYKSFDVLVPEGAQNQLPHVTLQLSPLSAQQKMQLQLFDEQPVGEILGALLNRSSGLELDDDFGSQLYNAFVRLVELVGNYDTIMQARFSAKEFRISCQHGGGTSSTPSCTSCTMLTVRFMTNIHASGPQKDFTFVPLSFFSMQQLEHGSHSDEGTFPRQVQTQFAHLQRYCIRRRGSNNTRGTKRPSVTEASRLRADSPRSVTFRHPLRKSVASSRRSDEATIIEHEKMPAEFSISDLHMARVLAQEYKDPQDEDTEALPIAASKERRSWVTEVFDLFQLKSEGWCTARTGGWKWDINVQNSFEVGSKERRRDSRNALILPF